MTALRAAMKACIDTPNLILRSRAERGVSKDGQQASCSFPSFETRCALLRMRSVRASFHGRAQRNHFFLLQELES